MGRRPGINFSFVFPHRSVCANKCCVKVLTHQNNVEGLYCSYECGGLEAPPPTPPFVLELRRRYTLYIKKANDVYAFYTKAERQMWHRKARYAALALQRLEGRKTDGR